MPPGTGGFSAWQASAGEQREGRRGRGSAARRGAGERGSGCDGRAAPGSGEPGRLECHTPRGAQAAINLKSLGILLAFSKYY